MGGSPLMVVVRSAFVCLAALLIADAARAAQTPAAPGRGELAVVVSDTTGARVADAAVVLTRGAERRTGVTDTNGVVRIANLSACTWTLSVTRDGFARWQ